MKISDLGASNDALKGAIALSVANIATQVTAIGSSDPGLSGAGLASLASITASVATIAAAAGLVKSSLQLRQDPPESQE